MEHEKQRTVMRFGNTVTVTKLNSYVPPTNNRDQQALHQQPTGHLGEKGVVKHDRILSQIYQRRRNNRVYEPSVNSKKCHSASHISEKFRSC